MGFHYGVFLVCVKKKISTLPRTWSEKIRVFTWDNNENYSTGCHTLQNMVRYLHFTALEFYRSYDKLSICSDSWVSYVILHRVFVSSLHQATCDCGTSTTSLLKLEGVTTSFYRRDRASLNNSISILLVWRKMFKDERYAREKRVRNCFKYWSWIEQRWKESEVNRK